MKNSMNPIYHNNSTILILGSLPGEKSLQNQEYYNNSTNQFWKILSLIFEEKIIEFSSYKDKINFLKKHHISLWDVIKRASRIGSLDKNIKDEEYNDICSFIKEHNISDIFVNGRKAENALKKYLKNNNINDITFKVLPSSSSANAKYTFSEKVNVWKKIIKGE